MVRDFKKLKIYHLSYNFLLEIYAMLDCFPDYELRNMFSQLQRAATSCVLNIVEGSANKSNKVFYNHLQYSYGSSKEVEVLLMLAYDLNYIEKELFDSLMNNLEELKGSLYNFMKIINEDIKITSGKNTIVKNLRNKSFSF